MRVCIHVCVYTYEREGRHAKEVKRRLKGDEEKEMRRRLSDEGHQEI